jgi:hypothetical protein
VQAHKWLNLAGSRFTEPEKEARDLFTESQKEARDKFIKSKKELQDTTVKMRDAIARTMMTPTQVLEAQRLAREWKPSSEFLKSIDPAEMQRLTDMVRNAARKFCAEGNLQACANYQNMR